MKKRWRIYASLLTATLLFFGFFPVDKKRAKAEKNHSVSRAECVMELDSGRIIYAENAEKRLPMASTTKILTAVTVLENLKDVTKEFTVPDLAIGIEGSSVYLKKGDIYTAEDLLYGLMLRSGNDCAVALALKTGGSLERFSAMMNYTAQKAGALESNFVTPHGLPHENHYTTAKDLAFITRYALQNEQFSQIVSCRFYEKCGWKNKNKMLDLFDGAIGVKTGYTKAAGRCLVSAAKRENMTLICVVLGCGDTYGRSSALLEDGFQSYERVKILSAQTPVEIKIGNKIVTGAVQKDLYYPILPEERALIKREVIGAISDKKTVKKGEIVGQIKISLLNRLLFFENLYKL